MTTPVYEFTPDQNAALTSLGNRMRFVGWGLVILAALTVAESTVMLTHRLGGRLGFAIGTGLLLVGTWSVRAAREFSGVTTTTGADVPHLMKALGELRKLYELQFWTLLAVAGAIALSLLAIISDPGRVSGPYP